jgi:predicted homoserine dehydrogenase-like protein
LPLGLAHKVKLLNDVAAGGLVRWSDVAVDTEAQTVKVRRAAEAMGTAKAA